MADNGTTIENLPKVDADLKSQLEGFKPELMKKASTQEKIVLPTAEGMVSKSLEWFAFNCKTSNY